MDKTTPTKRRNKHGVKDAWLRRRGITFPGDMADFIIAEAEKRHISAYQLVFDAVTLYVRVNPVEATNHHDAA